MLVRLDIGTDGVAVLTLDDDKRRNALTMAMVEEIVAAVDRVENDEAIGALVVTGAPPAFCAGADLSTLGSVGGEGVHSIYDGFLSVARCSLPTVAAVNGPAVGAGMNLALACDVRIAARSARFDVRFLRLGLHPGGGHTWMLHRAVGPQTAAAAALFGEVFDGSAAERVGLAWRCVDDDVLLAESRAMAAQSAAHPRELIRRIKQTLRAVPSIDEHDAAVALELEAQRWSLSQPEFAERLRAAQEKR